MSIILTFLAECRAMTDDQLRERCVTCYRLHRSIKSDHHRYQETLWCQRACEQRGRPALWDEAVRWVEAEEAQAQAQEKRT